MDFKKIFNTAKHMNLRQIYHRVPYEIKKRTRKNIKQYNLNSNNKEFKFKMYENISEISKREINLADDILVNKFTFLNTLTYKFTNKIEWQKNIFEYRLWNFNLNYFDFLEELIIANVITGDSKYVLKGVELINSWIYENKKYNPNSWDPYVISKRIYNWINFIEYAKKNMQIKNLNEIKNSILTQGMYLNSNIEYYLDANHVIMDAKGIIFFSVYVQNANLTKKGICILFEEFDRQVLSDGGHYERSPSYQVEVLSHYIEVYILLNRNKIFEYNKKIIEIIEKMSEYLSLIIKPDYKIPLLNDSSLEYPIIANDILQASSIILNKKICCDKNISNYVKKIFLVDEFYMLIKLENKKNENSNVKLLRETGYMILKDTINGEKLYALLDVGDGGPDYNLGHTHADSLNIILQIGGQDILIDPGTFTYKIGKKRDYYRSTLSHNTITIDKKNSSEIWSGFRVANRAKTVINRFYEAEKHMYISAFHTGYLKKGFNDSIKHNREVIYSYQNCLIIIDKLTGGITENHEAIINFNVGLKGFKENEMKFETSKNNIEFCLDTNLDIKLSKCKISKYFSVEEDCFNIKGSKVFNENIELITILKFNNKKININLLNKEEIIIDVGNELLKINRSI